MVEIVAASLIVYLLGGLLLLERRCLGQMAVVQPFVLCVAAGWMVDQVDLGVWCGISLQFFALSPGRKVDWALAGVISAGVIILSSYLELTLPVGGKGACTLIALAALAGIASRRLEILYAKTDGARILRKPPWEAPDSLQALEMVVHRTVVRWLFIGGAEVLVGTAAVAACVALASFGLPADARALSIGAVAVPGLGCAIAIGSLGSFKYIAWSGIVAAAGVLAIGGL